MPQTLNNDDLCQGMLHDYETRIWVNCNWVLDYVENHMTCNESGEGCKCRKELKEEVGIFHHLNNEEQTRFWKDFNYELGEMEGFRLPTYYGKIDEETFGAVCEVWTNMIAELKENEHNDECWETAKTDYKVITAQVSV